MFFLFNLLSIISLISLISSKRLFVYEHFRHGARGPCDGLDENNLDYLKIKWDTLGELTGVGMRMHYLLGYRNRLRYKDFISHKYDPRELYVISTDINRTIHSAISHLQGMYPPSTGPTLNEAQIKVARPPNDLSAIEEHIKSLNSDALPNTMQTIPYHIFFQGNHEFLLHDVGNCDKIPSIREENKKGKKITAAAQSFHSLYYEKLNKYYHYTNPDQLLNWTYVNYWCDHFIADLTEGRDLKAFVDVGINIDEMKDACHNVLYLTLFHVVFGDPNEDVAMMSMSKAMRNILSYMKKRVDLDLKGKPDIKDYSAPRFVIHSAHDTSVAGMLVFLNAAFDIGITSKFNPKYASNIYLELMKKDNDIQGDLSDYSVEFYFEDTLVKTIPYTSFTKISLLLWDDKKIDEYCGFKPEPEPKPESESTAAYWVAIGVLSAIVICLSGILIWIHCNKGKINNNRTTAVLTEDN